MARRPNYGFEKRQKELKRQKKKDRKAEKKALKKEAALAGERSEGSDRSDSDLGAVGDLLSEPDGKHDDGT